MDTYDTRKGTAMTPDELLADIHLTLKEVQTELRCHLRAYNLHCDEAKVRIDKLEQKTEENTLFRHKIIGVCLLMSVLMPVIYGVVEKFIK